MFLESCSNMDNCFLSNKRCMQNTYMAFWNDRACHLSWCPCQTPIPAPSNSCIYRLRLRELRRHRFLDLPFWACLASFCSCPSQSILPFSLCLAFPVSPFWICPVCQPFLVSMDLLLPLRTATKTSPSLKSSSN